MDEPTRDIRRRLFTAAIAVTVTVAAGVLAHADEQPGSVNAANATPIKPIPPPSRARFACDQVGQPYPEANLSRPPIAEREASARGASLRSFLAKEGLPARGWRWLYRRATHALAGYAGDPPRRGQAELAVGLRRTRRTAWTATGYDDCTPRRRVRGAQVAEWSFDRPGRHRRISRTATRVRLWVQTTPCGPRAEQRLLELGIRSTRRVLRIAVLLRPVRQRPACELSLMFAPIDVRLPEQIGARRIEDAALSPPTVVRDLSEPQ